MFSSIPGFSSGSLWTSEVTVVSVVSVVAIAAVVSVVSLISAVSVVSVGTVVPIAVVNTEKNRENLRKKNLTFTLETKSKLCSSRGSSTIAIGLGEMITT